jgi:dipeptidyl aminopeptidase/acylaminoacyl peptidase
MRKSICPTHPPIFIGILALPLVLIVFTVSAQTAKEGIRATDLLKIQSIREVVVNRQGSKAAFTLTRIEPDGDTKWDYKYTSHIYIVPTDGSGPPKEMTVKESSSQPAWSPDGKQLAFVRAVDGKPQVFILSLDGGEPVQFTHFKTGASGPKWSPDGKEILFASTIGLKDLLKDSVLNPDQKGPTWSLEQPGLNGLESLPAPSVKMNPDGNMAEIRAYLDNDAADKKAKVVTRLDFQDETGVNPDLSFTHFFVQQLQPRQGGSGPSVPGQAALVPAGPGLSRPIAVTHGFFRFGAVNFTPDGRQLIITANIDSTEHPDRSLESAIYLADGDGKNIQRILYRKGQAFTNPTLSPSGKLLAFLVGSTDKVDVPVLEILPLHGDPKDRLVIPFDRDKSGFTWSSDERYLYFTAQSNGGVPLYRLDIQSKKIDQLSDYNTGIGSFDIVNDRLIYAQTGVSDPFELYSADGSGKNPIRISSFNDDWLQFRQLSNPDKHEFKNSKGETIEYWVMKPTSYTPGKKVPLLLDIHGGPSAMWGPGESTMWQEFQFFCSKGYGVVYCNPRGSGGYGQDFLRANIGDWGTGPASDVLTALDKTVAEGWADSSRLLVSGGSYAGYLTAWIVGHDHRFKAACAQRGVYDLATFFGEGNAWRLLPDYFGGYPWEPNVKALLQRESPITYVQDITTPLIIFHGENDRRTGFVQGEMLYRSLKVLGRPVEYVRHPGATHELTRSGDNRQRLDQLLRTYEFFERWLNKK